MIQESEEERREVGCQWESPEEERREVGCQWESPEEERREVGCQSDSAERRDAAVQVDLLNQQLSWRHTGETHCRYDHWTKSPKHVEAAQTITSILSNLISGVNAHSETTANVNIYVCVCVCVCVCALRCVWRGVAVCVCQSR